ncbi:tRNA-specific 2-thiouridylase MnmA [Candidatus Annandia adelgestsuga]|uniref:tRNA-specific 2-thiouridylase MnmA n=1 Tax=Candidatus Annandia adelgestsuga TaxID=1302411 RepID=A0A3S9J7U4_9ENTR|nr:tRNA 2-thiouridine(34) synthase MnmA [Candidatus Annandia adelgestsuga]AZP36366.1 tRNA-specific 2-thiouridylase MnmA [Candidatus Annandia adelgestsuga]
MKKHNNKKIIVAMSGGVDSSVAAWILKKKGYQVEGIFMKNWEDNENNITKDFYDTKLVCKLLNIPLHKINFSQEYWNNVFKPFINGYKKGITPNPDIACNKKIKFKCLLKFAINNLRADYIATGHYVRCYKVKNNFFLLRGIDKIKDQSYFLYTLNNFQLSKSMFPIGYFKKKEIRLIAEKINLPVAKKKDSFGICFIGEKKFDKFISKYIYYKPGFIVDTKMNFIGIHKGLMYYTLGQRKGLKIGGIKKMINYPWYVIKKDFKNNYLIVSQNFYHPYLMSNGLIANKINWINYNFIKNISFCTAKIRYQQKDIPCHIIKKKKILLVFFFYQLIAVSPGQSIVFYYKEICLGGGIIKKLIPYVQLITYKNINKIINY